MIEYWISSDYIYTWLNGLLQVIFKYKQLWNEVRNNKHRTSSLRWRQDRKLISTTCYMTRFDNIDLLVSFPLQVWCKNFIGVFFVLRYRIIFLCMLIENIWMSYKLVIILHITTESFVVIKYIVFNFYFISHLQDVQWE